MTESPLLHAADAAGAMSPFPATEPLTHTQRRAVMIVTIMMAFIALACGIAGYMVGFRDGQAQSSPSQNPGESSPINPLPVSPLPSAGGGYQACTLEAKICADGSSVGRGGPNCEFSPCPGESINTAPNQSDVMPRGY